VRLLLIECVNIKTQSQTHAGLGLSYIAAVLREHIKNIEIMITFNVDTERILDDFKPDLIGLSCLTVNYKQACITARTCKARRIPVVIGGMHISMLPNNLTDDMDLAVMGEGELTMLEIVRVFTEYGMNTKRFEKIKGIAYRDKNTNQIITTPLRDLINQMDGLPFPARDLVEKKYRCVYMLTSRGCAYRCVFCSSSEFWQRMRFFSAEYVVSEMEFLIEKYELTTVSLMDDLFLGNKNRVRKIVQLVEQKGLSKDVVFHVSARANLVDQETVDLMKRMNVETVFMGLESGNEETLKFLKSGNVTVKDNERAIGLLTSAGINPTAAFIIGSPTETREQILETFNFIKDSKLVTFQVYPLVPLPGTRMWTYAKEKGLVSDDMDFELLDLGAHGNIVVSEVLEKDELLDLMKMFTKERKLRERRFAIRKLIYKRAPYLIKKGFKRPHAVLPWVAKRIWKENTFLSQ